MTLNETKQALLDAFCHCYGQLLGHLDTLRDATDSHRKYSEYTLVKNCFDEAVGVIATQEAETVDRSELCEQFLSSVEGFIQGKLGATTPVLDAFADYRQAVGEAEIESDVDLMCWQSLGEELSTACYRAYTPGGAHSAESELRAMSIEESATEGMATLRPAEGGDCEIIFYLCLPSFLFKSYVNLPLYCFHECLSHVHSARMLGESDQSCPKVFEQGWLLYLAHQLYIEHLLEQPHPRLDHHSHRAHYAHQYFQDQNVDDNNEPWVAHGYEQARNFERVCS